MRDVAKLEIVLSGLRGWWIFLTVKLNWSLNSSASSGSIVWKRQINFKGEKIAAKNVRRVGRWLPVGVPPSDPDIFRRLEKVRKTFKFHNKLTESCSKHDCASFSVKKLLWQRFLVQNKLKIVWMDVAHFQDGFSHEAELSTKLQFRESRKVPARLSQRKKRITRQFHSIVQAFCRAFPFWLKRTKDLLAREELAQSSLDIYRKPKIFSLKSPNRDFEG